MLPIKLEGLKEKERNTGMNLDVLRNRYEKLKELRNIIAHGYLSNINPSSTFDQIKISLSSEDEKKLINKN